MNKEQEEANKEEKALEERTRVMLIKGGITDPVAQEHWIVIRKMISFVGAIAADKDSDYSCPTVNEMARKLMAAHKIATDALKAHVARIKQGAAEE